MSFEEIRYDNYCFNKGFIFIKNDKLSKDVYNLIYKVLKLKYDERSKYWWVFGGIKDGVEIKIVYKGFGL